MNHATLIDCDAEDGATFRPQTAVSATDIYELLRFFVLQGIAAWFVSPRHWGHIAGLFGRLSVALNPKRAAASLIRIESVRRGETGMRDALSIERGFYAGRYEERFQYLRSHRPGGWNPEIRIHGKEHLETSRAAGQGIILWAGNFAYNDLIAKIAWARAGLRVSHYTRPAHGLSKTRFGLRVLNPIRTSVEDRHLAERVSAEINVSAAMRILRQRLTEGGVISVTVGDRGRNQTEAPFLGGALRLATGVPAIACRTGAALVPIYTLKARDGSFDVTFGAALTSGENKVEAQVVDILAQYAAQLAPYVRRCPEQWRGWRYVAVDDLP